MSTLKRCITTLPITPITPPHLGLMVLPFVADVLSKKLCLDSVVALNVNGLKLPREDMQFFIDSYLETLGAIGVDTRTVWSDGQGENIYFLNALFSRLSASKNIVNREVGTFRCPCGAVEMLKVAENRSERRKLYRTVSGKFICLICSEEAVLRQEVGYLFKFPDISRAINAYPVFCAKEMSALARKFAGQEFLISRNRKSGISIWSGREIISLDVDFVWYLLVPVMESFGWYPEAIIGSRRNLMACCFIAAMSHILCERIPWFVIPPYYYAERGVPLKHAFSLGIPELVTKYKTSAFRLFLATGLNWGKQQSSLETYLLPLLGSVMSRLESKPQEYNSLIAAIKDLDGYGIKQLIGTARKQPQKTYSTMLFGII